MKIELDLEYEEAVQLRDRLKLGTDPTQKLLCAVSEDIIGVLDEAIQNEDERQGMAHAESLLESGGADDSKYRRDMIDAGRGHLLR